MIVSMTELQAWLEELKIEPSSVQVKLRFIRKADADTVAEKLAEGDDKYTRITSGAVGDLNFSLGLVSSD